MKQKLALLLGVTLSIVTLSAQDDPTIMTINGEPILKSEFEYIYNKNNSNTALDKKSLNEYVDLFINFKLKVAEAKFKNIQNKKSYIQELENYKEQLSAPYMTDKETEEEVLKEAYERMKEDIEVSHILIKSSRTDTTETYMQICKLYDKLRNGADFAVLAKENSQCPTSSKGGYLGYITAFMTVYPFETAAYNTPVGTYSSPIHSSFGYHIIKVHSKRANKGKVKIAHIFKRTDGTNKDLAKQKIDSLYQLLQRGADFAEIAKSYSDDYQNASKGGDMGWIESGRFPFEFENTAYTLKNKGEISNVIQTPFGYHILKLEDKKGLDSYENLYDELKKKISRDERAKRLNDSYIEKLKQKYGFTYMAGALDSFYPLLDEKNESVLNSAYLRMDEPLYTLKGNYYPQKSFISYFKLEKEKRVQAKNSKSGEGSIEKVEAEMSAKDFVNMAFAKYVKNIVVSEEEESLLKEYPEYRNLLREYSDGLLLFEVSNEEVWNKASSDLDGLERFFNENKDNYKWDSPRFRGKVIRCTDTKTLAEVEKIMKKVPKDSVDLQLKRKFNVNGKNQIKIENGLYAKGTNKAVDTYIFKSDSYTDTTYPFVSCFGEMVSTPESYKDVKGPVTADYQNYLEEEWIKKLRKKYKVVINQDVLKTVKSN